MVEPGPGKGSIPPFPAEKRLFIFFETALFHKGKYIRIAGNIGD